MSADAGDPGAPRRAAAVPAPAGGAGEAAPAGDAGEAALPRLRVAYFGRPGTFSHEVASRRFGQGADLTPRRTISAVFDAVAGDAATYGVVPIENAVGGPIYDTVDRLIRREGTGAELVVCEELSLHVTLSLLGRRGAAPRRIYSHFVPLKHCGDWLRAQYPDAQILEAESTAEAVERAAQDGEAWAVGNKGAAAIYQLEILVPKLAVKGENVTRFFVVGRTAEPPPSGGRTLLVFGLEHRPSALVAALSALGRYGINLTRIVSRALPDSPEEYLFLVECEGSTQEPSFKEALALLEQHATGVRSLGSFRVSQKYE
ncbi:bifunctional chorismate mutase/prephenate dehydratase [Sorangium cellulosum]|uniref:prephenate dehydratase n=1 Tax=Sorangium cellulosum TaxID=56 RepID=A0A4P2Q825_SORCE|nr:prephenate dehydratase domain-containing protein [Sorangium cellulosum]AUX25707.1 bifunctional chorismate mutase/prephenate dehydratase [Sorangium cellulosum]